MEKIWKPIKDYEDLYLISNYGEVYSIRNKRELNLQISKDGYTKVVLWKNGKPYYTTAHRLVAETFIPNIKNKPFVLHKIAISNGGTNYVDNLYWGTQSDNMKDRVKDGNQPFQNWNVGKNHPFAKKINQYDLNHNFIRQYDCIMDASKELNIKHQHIWRVLNKVPKRKSVKGFIFEYAE